MAYHEPLRRASRAIRQHTAHIFMIAMFYTMLFFSSGRYNRTP